VPGTRAGWQFRARAAGVEESFGNFNTLGV